eukprot:scaffold21256_cov40-Cyclotella_meneghiniana.AAC.4
MGNGEDMAASTADWKACKKASRWDGELANSDGRMSGWMSHMMSALLILLLLSAIMLDRGR